VSKVRRIAATPHPTGWLLVSFHIDAPDLPAGAIHHVRTFLGHDVDMNGYFLALDTVIDDLTATGFSIHSRLDRRPNPDIEFPSRRCYLLAQNGTP
jgi:hypothetical protein